MRTTHRWTILALLLTGLLLPVVARTAETNTRPAAWATRLDRPGLPNLHKIDDGLYRGAQPTTQGIRELEKLGVKTIINLRSNHSDRGFLGNAKIAYEEIPMNAWGAKESDVVRFLQIVGDKNRRPVFVHCQHGADRAGAMCAAYRVAVSGWTKQQAVDEMTKGGFGFSPMWGNLITLVQGIDAEKTKAKAGLKGEPVVAKQ